MKYTPHNYQKRAIKFVIERGAAGLFLDPGLGKTSITYASFRVLRRAQQVQNMLVVAPLRPATSTWPREAQKWDDFKDLNVHVLHGDHKQMLLEQPHDVSVVNPEGLEWLLGITDAKGKYWKGAAQKLGMKWDMLVVDESTRFKHPNTKRFKVLKNHLHKFDRRVILTGSPAPNGYADLFGQIYLLDMGRSLGEYITHFRNKYFFSTGFGGYTLIPKENTQEDIQERIKPLVLRMAAEDYLDMEPYVSNVIEVDLPEDARRTYYSMEKLLIAQVKEGLVTAANVATSTQKCRQIANGGIYLDPEFDETTERLKPRKVSQIHDAKTEAVVELIEELSGQPALIAYEFKHDLERLQKVFPDAPYLGGGVNPKKSREIEDKWNAGLIPVLLAQPQSVAHGLNLQGVGAAVIWYGLTYNLEDYEQFIRRIWRQGQKARVVVHHIVARKTVDEAIMKGIGKKDRTQRALLAALKEHLAGK